MCQAVWAEHYRRPDNAKNAIMHEKQLRTLTHTKQFSPYFFPILFISLRTIHSFSSFCLLKYSRIVKLSSSILYLRPSHIHIDFFYCSSDNLRTHATWLNGNWPHRHLCFAANKMWCVQMHSATPTCWQYIRRIQNPNADVLSCVFKLNEVKLNDHWENTTITADPTTPCTPCGQRNSLDIELKFRGRNAWRPIENVVIMWALDKWPLQWN